MDSDDYWDDLTADDIEILEELERNTKKCENLNETAFTQTTQVVAEFLNDSNDPQMEHFECLRSKFSHNLFRTKQWDIIRSIMSEKRDVCAVMATGYGKSLCYQFPAVYKNGMTLVISPLIALMQAQVIDLNKAGISACLVGSAQKDNNILDKIADRRYTVVYSSPEYLQTPKGNQLLSILNGRLTLIAIDEAHCVSQWGHDFRPDFRKLNIIREKIPNTPILAVTATATENVRYDIINLLKLKEPRVIMTSFDRSNLEFVIQRKRSYISDLPPRIRNVDGSVIVYVLKRKEAEDIADGLRNLGIDCAHYHAGLKIKRRTEVLEQFLNDELKVIVATIAFGMGIDKRDIRCVIHYGASKNIESYYQEVGRARRDGQYAKVITFFNKDDFVLHDWFLDQQERKDSSMSPEIKNYLRSLGAKMRDFLYSRQCRRKTILEYFGEDVTALTPRPNCCDNCTVSNEPNRNHNTVTRTVSNYSRRGSTLTADVLKEILMKVRDSIAVKYNVPENEKNAIASLVALDKMVTTKPQNLDEFRYATLDGFNEAKINKYGPTFVNVISKFVKGELEMQNILLNHPMPKVNMNRIVSPQVLRLLKQKRSKSDIIQLTRLNEDQLYSDIETLIKTGQPILKTDLSTIHEIDFNAFSQCINEQEFDILNVDENMLRQIQTNYNKLTNHQIDSGLTKLVLVYYGVRSYLNGLNLPYVDYDGSIIINGQHLIVQERIGTLNTTFETDREYPPLFTRNNNIVVGAQMVMDFLFGQCVSCDRNYHHYDSRQLEYEPVEFNGYDTLSEDETNDGSEEENDDEYTNHDESVNDGSVYESESINSEGSDNSDIGSDDDSQETSTNDQSSNDIEDGGERKRRRMN